MIVNFMMPNFFIDQKKDKKKKILELVKVSINRVECY